MQERTINFVTSNKGKLATMQKHIAPHGYKVAQVTLDIIEPQADTIAEVALAKAKQAYAQLQQPLLVDDSGFYIKALSGFPGPYTKYALGTLGAQGIVDVMKHQPERHSYFTSALVFIDENGEQHMFEGEVHGTLTTELDATNDERAWSELWKCFIPDGHEKTFSAFTPDDWQKYNPNQAPSVYSKFATWLAGRD